MFAAAITHHADGNFRQALENFIEHVAGFGDFITDNRHDGLLRLHVGRSERFPGIAATSALPVAEAL